MTESSQPGAKGVQRMNFRQRRFRYGLLLGAAFLVGVVSGPTVGVLGRAVAQDRSRAEASQFLKIFGDVFVKLVIPCISETRVWNLHDQLRTVRVLN